MRIKALISLSGGMDSATVLAQALARDRECYAVGFTYGSKHNKYENEMARQLADYYNIKFNLIDLSHFMQNFKSNLMLTGDEIPEGQYEYESMKLTVVPARNIIFSSILAGIAESINCQEVWLGIHSGDHAIYPDCRPTFFQAMKDAIQYGTDGKVTLVAPFLELDKNAILGIGFNLEVPYKLTRTCYKDQPTACGKCGSCQERLEAFRYHKVVDPIIYSGDF